MATTAAGGSSEGAPEAARGRRAGWLTPVNAIILVATLLALGLRVYYQFTRPGFLLGVNEYDDGPYFGSAVRLVHGVLPYRGFVIVQPPGITLLMAPAGGLSYIVGTAWAMAAGRILTVLAGAAAVVLAGLLVRHRGIVAVVVTCGIMAIYPDSVAAAHTVLVEPWLVFFCLLGAVALFDRDRLAASTRRLVWGGVAFGFAGAVEAWAIVPVVVLFLLCLPDLRRALRFAGGVAAGFLVPSLPFAALGPHQFYRSLITAQIGSRAHAYRVGLWYRLKNIDGLLPTVNWSHGVITAVTLAILAVVIGGQFYAWVAGNRPARTLDWFVMIAGIGVIAMFLWPPQFHYHFTAFMAPFVALALGLTLASAAATAAGREPGTAGAARWIVPGTAGLAAIVLAVLAVFQGNSERVVPPVIGRIPASVERLIPPGACVLSDQVSVTLAANRFVSNVPGCPEIVDSLGTVLGLSHGLKPGTGAGKVPAVAAFWLNAFKHSQYLLLTNINRKRIGWTPSLENYVQANFIPEQPSPRIMVYVRKGLRVH
jgi:hypothetical protein